MKNPAILVTTLFAFTALSVVAMAANEQKPGTKAPATEHAAKGLLACTRECGSQHKDPESRARCIGRAQASGKCSR